MSTKINRRRLISLGTLAMCMLVIVVALGACSPAEQNNASSNAEPKTEAATPKESTEDPAESKADTDKVENTAEDTAEKDAAKEDSKSSKDETNEAAADKADKADKADEADEGKNADASKSAQNEQPEKSDAADASSADDNAEPSASTAPATQASWADGRDCTSCHTKVADTLENSDCLVSKHTTLECVTCHADASLADVHADVSADDRMPSSLRSSVVDTANCESCHNPETLVEATVDSTILTDDNNTVVNPHDLPGVAEHAEVTCISCHKMHSKTGIEKSASRACQSCHHTNVYECGTCHAA